MTYDGNCRLGDLFISRREKGREGLPTLSVTLNNGLVDREDLARKMETNLAENEHLLVRKGDIAYNMMRMWQGACGLAAKDGLVSPAYVVLKPKPSIDSRYAAYLFKTKRMQYLFWAYSYGLTDDRLRLYFPDFAKIPVNVPEIWEQRKIADILSTWEKAIEAVEKLIENNKAQKKVLIKALFAHSESWPKYSLAQVASKMKYSLVGGPFGSSLRAQDYTETGVRIIQLQNIGDGWFNDEYKIYTSQQKADELIANNIFPGDIILSKMGDPVARASIVPIFESRYLMASDGIRLVVDAERFDKYFIYFQINSPDFRRRATQKSIGSTRKRINLDDLRRLKVHAPNLDHQRVVSITIRNADDKTLALEAQRSWLIKEKSALMRQLLTGKRRVKLDVPSANPAAA